MASRYQTPRSRVFWSTLAEWVAAAHRLDKRSASKLRNDQCDLHVIALPVEIITGEPSPDTLQAALALLTGYSSFRQPPRGQRGNAPHTPLVCAIKNRMRQIERDMDFETMATGHNSAAMRGYCHE